MQIPAWQRAVFKVGSNLIAPAGLALSTRHLLGIARVIDQARTSGREIIVVSSGAVAAGRAALRAHGKPIPTGVSGKQALAALGQAELMRFWARFFDTPVAQLLLTIDDLSDRGRFLNARNTLRELRQLSVLPVVNENDSVAVSELRVGDNDNLAAHVAALAEADLLVLCSDIDGLYPADPRSNPGVARIDEVPLIDDRILAMAGGSGSAVGTGGMLTKLQAARRAAERGIGTVILDGADETALSALLVNQCKGTYFHPAQQRRAARKHWMLHALPCSGRILVDSGAAKAVRESGASLLPKGVESCEGSFDAGDAVELLHANQVIAKGISQYAASELVRIRGRHSRDIRDLLGEGAPETVIHRDDLVLT